MDAAQHQDNTASESRGPRYAYMRRDGTLDIVVGSFIAGIGAYAYQFLGGRSLGEEAFAPIGVLLTVHFLAFVVVLLPVEQFIIRRLTLGARGWVIPVRALAFIVVATAASGYVMAVAGDDYFVGTSRVTFIAIMLATMAGHFLFVVGRGYLAGYRRFRSYGYSSGAASMLRLVIALVVAVIAPTVTGFAWAHVIGPLIVVAWRPFKEPSVRRRGSRVLDGEFTSAIDDRGLLAGLVLAAAASQALLLAGPLVASRLSATAAEFSVTYATLLIARAPLTLGYNLIARVLPPFTEMAARGERRELRAWARGIGLASAVLAVVGAGVGAVTGPFLVSVAFGSGFAPTATVAAISGAGVVLASGGLFVGQILVARGQAFRLGVSWFLAVAAAAAVVAVPMDDPVMHVVVAFLVGELVALTALMSSALMRDRAEAEAPQGYAVAKRSIDIAMSVVALILLAPVFLIVAIAVRLDSKGPALFRQVRVGRGGEDFWMTKYRTMVLDHEEEVFHRHLERLREADGDEVYTIRIDDDPRITRVGSVLRRWSLDELPNLWNVLKGSMSLVGPRPLVRAEAELIGFGHPRFTVKPGVTGLAQVRGRDNISIEARTEHDEEYVRTRSLRLDLRILTATVVAVFRDPGEQHLV
jgi:lipopolysaccharide/colanic/teichoic acid biosynthesis glycosyltransferase